MFRHRPGLVALQRPDEMPLQVEIREGLDFLQGFLNVTLAEPPLACGCGLPDRPLREGFAHRQQRNAIGITSGRMCSRGNP